MFFSSLKSLSQSKQWHFLNKNGKGIPMKRIAIAIAPLDGFDFETSKEPHTGQFNFFIDNYRILKLNNKLLVSQILKLILSG